MEIVYNSLGGESRERALYRQEKNFKNFFETRIFRGRDILLCINGPGLYRIPYRETVGMVANGLRAVESGGVVGSGGKWDYRVK